ncbi:uncharacterized protein BKA55DRAFT_587541 [Fusarium redolens]|uniref:Uncharacterized protein n=1 Tax=Fusarium redolens TaxID=48865 RepID=A0A9P9JNW4_FUSRE|nr:uncharacterized protein BKA55DRAFT_587541 [Fusarium redolens]KAH7203081.1 hypothetical protein BKA55DRAFT_587541 [Fusarium redolens]
MLMCALTVTTTCYCLILQGYFVPECVYKSMAGNQSFRNPSPRSSGQPATYNANVSPLLMRGRILVPKGIKRRKEWRKEDKKKDSRTCAEASALNGQAMILNGLTLKATYDDHSGA